MSEASDKNGAAPNGRLLDLRGKINDIDKALLALLNQRAGLSVEVGQIKAGAREAVFKPFREKEVMAHLVAANEGLRGRLPEKHLRAIYREILSSSRQLQSPQKIVYLGPEGTFSYFAGIEYLGQSADYQACDSFLDVFQAVYNGNAELGIVPLENSLQGTVGQNLDLFLRFDVYIQAEIYCRISHSLLSQVESLAEVKAVYSHPQALAQCAGWIRANLPGIRLVPTESTAAAAEHAKNEAGAAAIGHRRLAEMVGLKVLAARLEDLEDNWTRFLVIGRTRTVQGSQDKTSLLFTVPDKPGSLAGVLNLLAMEGINMKKLESRPMRGEKWKYVFFADVECDLAKEEYQKVLGDLAANCHTLRILGSYPAGPYLDVSKAG